MVQAMRRDSGIKAETLLTVAFGSAFVVAAVVIVILVHRNLRQQALVEAQNKASLLLGRNLATHGYFTEELKPAVSKAMQDPTAPGYFDPSWMSSTYALRRIDQRFKMHGRERYYFKECAINARSPENEADDHERTFLEQLNAAGAVSESFGIREYKGERSFYVLRRGETMEASCMACHSQPDKAPAGLIARYGDRRSFGRDVGEVASALSVRIPLEQAYLDADRFALRLSGMLLLILAFLFVTQHILSRYLVFRPLAAIRTKAEQIASDPDLVGETVPDGVGEEIARLGGAFNAMSISLREQRRELEDNVAERTEELAANVEKLQREAAAHKTLEKRLEHMALHDPLTGLPNRRLFDEALRRAQSRAKRGQPGTLALLDIDYFKEINDLHGHDAGDAALKQIAAIIGRSLRESDVLARLGGDEFVILLEAVEPREAESIILRATECLSAEFMLENIAAPTVSVGLTQIVADLSPAENLIRADRAMYEAKKRGRNCLSALTERNVGAPMPFDTTFKRT